MRKDNISPGKPQQAHVFFFYLSNAIGYWSSDISYMYKLAQPPSPVENRLRNRSTKIAIGSGPFLSDPSHTGNGWSSKVVHSGRIADRVISYDVIVTAEGCSAWRLASRKIFGNKRADRFQNRRAKGKRSSNGHLD